MKNQGILAMKLILGHLLLKLLKTATLIFTFQLYQAARGACVLAELQTAISDRVYETAGWLAGWLAFVDLLRVGH